ncbi:MAG: hypothetical protein IPG51_04725 [Chloroflexi bacterium]|nr:hypothetical protein [Chloroflexota bacterium]
MGRSPSSGVGTAVCRLGLRVDGFDCCAAPPALGYGLLMADGSLAAILLALGLAFGRGSQRWG